MCNRFRTTHPPGLTGVLTTLPWKAGKSEPNGVAPKVRNAIEAERQTAEHNTVDPRAVAQNPKSTIFLITLLYPLLYPVIRMIFQSIHDRFQSFFIQPFCYP
jgi:hypothetical protein